MLAQIKRVFKDTTIYGLGSLLPKLAGVVLFPVYTRLLTPSDYGIMSLATLVTSMVGVAMMVGQNGSLTLYYRSADATSDEEGRRRLLFSVTVFVLVFGAAVFALLYALGPLLTQRLIASPRFTFHPYLVVAIVTAYAQLPFLLLQAVNRARGQALTHTSFQVASFLFNMAFTVYFVVALRQGALGSIKGTLAAALVVAPVALVILGCQMRFRFSGEWLKRSLVFGLPLVPHYVAGWVLTFADRALLARFRTMDEVGLYSAAYSVALVMNMLALAINQAWGPIYYDLADSDEERRMLPKLIVVYGATVAVLAMGLILFCREGLLLLAGRRFWDAAPLVPVVVAAYYLFATYSVVSTAIFYRKRTRYVPLISALAAAVNIGLNLFLIPRYGVWAAAWATFAAYGLMAVVSYLVSRRLMPGTLDGRRIATTVAVVCCVLAANQAVIASGWSIWLTLPVKVVLLAAGVGALLALDVVSMRDVRSLVDRIARRGGRLVRVPHDEEAALQAMAEEEAGHAAGDTGVSQTPS